MRKRCTNATGRIAGPLAGLLALALCSLWPSPTAAADPYREVTLSLGQELLALFPAVEGFVVSAAAGDVYVDLAEKDLVKPGMELQVYRAGAEMVHPLTGQVLGAYETALGHLRLVEVREKYSRGAFEPSGAEGVVAGDRVRVSARRLRSLLAVSGAAPGVEIGPLVQALLARGAESQRFTLIDEPAWAPALAATGLTLEATLADPAALRRLGEKAAADLLLRLRVIPAERPLVALEVRSLRTGAALAEVNAIWPAAPATSTGKAPAPVAATTAPSSTAPAALEGEYVVRELAGAATALAAGDILGDGRVDVLLSDGRRIALYRWEEKELAWRWDEEGRLNRRILSLDAADLDGDGRSEVLVTAVTGGRVVTEVRAWRGAALDVVGRADGLYLRSAARPGAAPLLLGQRSGIGEVLSGRVEQYRWREGSIERVDGTALPAGVGLFGLAATPSDGPAAVFSLAPSGYLYSYSARGDALWRSARTYGGYPPPAKARELGWPENFGGEDDNAFEEAAKAFQGRLLVEESGEGLRLFVPRNFSDLPLALPRLRGLGKGEIVVLEGSATSLDEVRRSRAFDGYVSDVARADVDGDGAAEVLFTVTRLAGPLLGERGRLVVWRLRPPRGGK